MTHRTDKSRTARRVEYPVGRVGAGLLDSLFSYVLDRLLTHDGNGRSGPRERSITKDPHEGPSEHQSSYPFIYAHQFPHQTVIFILTGAGVSAESGIPTFRGVGGLWRNYRIEEVASPEAWHRDPQLVWEFYSMRRRVASAAKPNPAHFALAKIEDSAARPPLRLHSERR
jgi:hypothetical protein